MTDDLYQICAVRYAHHIERIAGFRANLRPFAYVRLRRYAQALIEAIDAEELPWNVQRR
jgi:hypothetical protein